MLTKYLFKTQKPLVYVLDNNWSILDGGQDNIMSLYHLFSYCRLEAVNLDTPNNSYKLYAQAEKLLKGASYES